MILEAHASLLLASSVTLSSICLWTCGTCPYVDIISSSMNVFHVSSCSLHYPSMKFIEVLLIYLKFFSVKVLTSYLNLCQVCQFLSSLVKYAPLWYILAFLLVLFWLLPLLPVKKKLPPWWFAHSKTFFIYILIWIWGMDMDRNT